MDVSNADVGDAELVARVRRGDTAAFEVLVRRHFRAAYAIALSQMGNAMDAEDVCQDAFVRALERIDDCRHPERFVGWLLTIVRNTAHNYREYRARRAGQSLDHVNPAAESGRPAEQLELRERLEEALATLSAVQREIVLLHDLDGWTHQAIGAALGVSEVNSRQHLFVARKKLRRALGTRILEEHFDE